MWSCRAICYLPLPRGQQVQPRIDRRRRLPGERVQDEPRQPRREYRVTLEDAGDRGDQVSRRDRLRHVSAGAGPDHGDHVLRRVRDRQRQEPDVRVGLPDRLDHRQAAPVGHVDVHQNDVRLPRPDPLDGRGHVGGVPDQLERLAQLGADARQEQPVVVDQEHPDRPGHDPSRLGMRRWTSVPSAGTLLTVATPPPRSIRPTIDSLIPWRSVGTSTSSNPLPSSRT